MASEAAVERLRKWITDPSEFVADNFGVVPDAWQMDVLKLLPSKGGVSRIAMKACAGPGKSALLAWAGWWFLATQSERGQHPKGIALAITWDNLRDNLWPELAKWQQRSPFLTAAFTHQKERVFNNDHPSTWFLAARSFPKAADANTQGQTLSGLHSEYIFYLLDESGDMAPSIGRAAEQGLGAGVKTGLCLQAGNPTSTTGLLHDTMGSPGWQHISITSDPDDPKRTPRVDAKWAREQIETYGRENPWVMAYILGQFPPGSLTSLLGEEEVRQAMNRTLPEQAYAHAARILGVDVARFGDDRTVIVGRQGWWSGIPVVLRGADTNRVVAEVATQCDRWGADAIFVDGTGGYGAGVIDNLRASNYPVIEVNASSKPNDPRYFNKRAECWFLMADWIKKQGKLHNDTAYLKELPAIQYTFHGSKMQLEDKGMLKKRIGMSPDAADALSITFAQPIQPKFDDTNPYSKRGKVESEYNHLAEMLR